ncbi:MAG TPA: alpha/beta hydrolase [Dehalococcoidia bacterium]|nr:alpha/beta hydrolase [Dehalococcoidia bacterium]
MTTETQTGYFQHNGGRLYFETAGQGEPVVFVHGFTLDTRMWDDQWQPFADAGYQVIRYDVRGFGRSSDPEGAYANQEDLKALLDHLGAERPHVVGLSMGGQIALDYAVTYPEAMRSLVLIDSALGGHTWTPAFRPGVLGLADIAQRDGVAMALEVWMNNDLFAAARANACAPRLAEIVTQYRGYRWLQNDPVLSLEPPAATILDRISAPTLAMVGEHDLPDFHNIAGYVAEHAPNARKVVVPGAGHMANMEAPEQVNQLIFEFLATR